PRSWWGNPWGFESLRSHWPPAAEGCRGLVDDLHRPPQLPIPTPIRFGSPMPEILVKKTRAEPGEASLEVTIPPDNVKAAEERATKVYQQRARLPGFRQGKVPAAVVRKKFAEDIRQETLRELVQESWRVAQKQEELKPIADPHIHNLKWEDGAPVTFEFHVELKPDPTLH